MEDEENKKEKPVLGEMIANFPVEELKKAMQDSAKDKKF